MIGNLNSAQFSELLFAVSKDPHFKDMTLGELTKKEVLELFRTFKLLEVSMAAAVGGVSTLGIDSVLLVKSKFKGRPFISRRSSRMIQDFVVKNPDLCRSVPSEDLEENVRRTLALFKSLSAAQERTASSDS